MGKQTDLTVASTAKGNGKGTALKTPGPPDLSTLS